VAAQLHGLAKNRQQVAGDAFDVITFRDFLENDDEFVPPSRATTSLERKVLRNLLLISVSKISPAS
jgi:hypothetical protein